MEQEPSHDFDEEAEERWLDEGGHPPSDEDEEAETLDDARDPEIPDTDTSR